MRKRITYMLDTNAIDIVSQIAEQTKRKKSMVVEMAILEFVKNFKQDPWSIRDEYKG